MREESDKQKTEASKFDDVLNSSVYIVGLPILTIGFGSLVYFTWFVLINGQELSTSAEDWGTFGDFIGGIVNPVLGFATLVFVAVNYLSQRKEYIRAEKEAKAAHNISLFDKRIKIFIEFEEMFRAFVRNGKPDRDAVLKLRYEARHALFLFPATIDDFLEEIVKKTLDHHVAHQEWEPLRARAFENDELSPAERSTLHSSLEKMHSIQNWFLEQVESGRLMREFEPHLKLSTPT